MGAPIRGVITFMGMMLPFEGVLHIRLQSSVMQAPMSIDPGSRVLCFPVRKTRRPMCGTAKPRNEIGPQKAVVVAVKSPVQISRHFLVSRMFTPRFVAYCSPNSNASSDLVSIMVPHKPNPIRPAKRGKRSSDTLLKLPMPQIM